MPRTRSGVLRAAACAAGLVLGLLAISGTRAAPESTTATIYGLEWPGTGSTRRMLYWANPQNSGLPIYDATYIFRVYPRKKQYPGSCYVSGSSCNNKYWTTFFWGNNGDFTWRGDPGETSCSSGAADTYYGAHPYPGCGGGAPNGTQAWEISVRASDYMDPDGPAGCSEVSWDRWYTQAFVATRSGTSYTHKFYWDLPDTSKVITVSFNDSLWNTANPPHPALVMGQAPDYNGSSWGCYAGWEEFSGVIRGIQIYNNDLSITDIQAEIDSPQSTTAGNASIWYLNLDPRPSDVTDKKTGGTPHNPSWDGTTAFEWSSTTGGPTPPPTPTGVRVN